MNSTVPTSPRPLSRIRRRVSSICSGSIGAESPAPRFSTACGTFGIASRAAALSAAGFLALSGPAQAATRTWTSTSAGGATWTAAADWGGTAPVANDLLVFQIPVTSGTRTTTNDFAAGTQFNGITVNAGAFTLAGNAINLGGNFSLNVATTSTLLTQNLNTTLLQNTDINVTGVASGTQPRIDWNGLISGNFGISKSGTGTLRLQNNAATYTGDTTINAGLFDLNFTNWFANGSGKGNVIIASAGTFGFRGNQSINGLSDGTGGGGSITGLASSTKTLTVGNGDANGSFSGIIFNGTGVTAFTKTGLGTQTLSGANQFTGTTTINGGILNVGSLANGGSNSAIGAGANTVGLLAFGAGTLQYTGSTAQSTDHLFTINTGGATLDASGTGSGTMSFANTGALNTGTGTTARSLTLTGSNIGANTLASTLGTGTSTISLNKSGLGTWVLSGTNAYTGGTTISSGTLSIGADTNIGNVGVSGTSFGGAIGLAGGTLQTTNTSALVGTHAITVTTGSTINITGIGAAGTQGGRVILDTTNALLGTAALIVAGNGALDSSGGSGVLVLNKSNTYGGSITLQNGGMIEVGNSSAVGSGATFTLGANGGLAVNTGITLSNAITVSGSGSILSFGNANAGIVSSLITLNADLTVGLRDWYSLGQVHNGTISGAISGAFGLSVNSGTGSGGVLTLTGTNLYAGTTTISSSTLQIGDGATDGNIATSSNIVDNGALVYNRVGNFSYGNVISGNGTLTKSGAGTQTLSGANSYSGNTNVDGGTLVIAGNQTGNGQLIVSNASILQFGNGTSTNGSSVNSGTIFVNNTGTVAINKADGGTVTNQIASNPSAVTTLSGLNATGTTNTFTGTEFGNGGSFATNSTNAGATLAFSNSQAIDLKATNLTVGGAGNTLFSGSIYSSSNSGNIVTKNGAGTLIYQANQGYTGETDINAGAVRVDTAQTNGGTYFVGNGGTTTTAASVLLGGGAAGLTGGVTFDRSVSINTGDGTTGSRVIGGTNTSGTNTFSGAVTFVGADNSGQDRSITLTAATGGTVAFTGGLTGGGFGVGQNVTKTGGGTVAIQSTASYFGTTTVSAGTLAVGTAAANGSLSNTSGVTVTGGTLLLGGTGDRIANGAGLTLGTGGKFGFDSTVTGGSETMGALTLSADSTIDFGTGNSNTLNFASLALNNHNLTVLGWTGTYYTAAETADHSAGTQDRLLFSSDPITGNTLGSISFYNDAGGLIGTGKEVSFGNGTYSFEIVPVPEPTTIFGALALLGLVGVRELRRKRRAGSE